MSLRKSLSRELSSPGDEQALVGRLSLEGVHSLLVKELQAALGPLTGRALQYASDDCLMRYLRARNWNVKKAEKMLRETLAWRATYKPEEICWEQIAVEAETGKCYRANYTDKQGHTVLVMHPGRQNTTNPDGHIRQLVYALEDAILNLPAGQEQMVWLINFKGLTMKNSTPIKTARESANILQKHYPERLNAIILYNPPRVFEAFWGIIKPVLDPKTFSKVKFVYTRNPETMKHLYEHFNKDSVETVCDNPSDYNHEEYSKLMLQSDMKCATYWKVGAQQDSTPITPDLSNMELRR